LLKHGIKVDYWKSRIESNFIDVENNENNNLEDESNHGMSASEESKSPDPIKDYVWLIKISIPRRLVNQMSAEELDFYDEDVDVEDVEDAKDTGIDDESSYTTQEDELNAEDTNSQSSPTGEINA